MKSLRRPASRLKVQELYFPSEGKFAPDHLTCEPSWERCRTRKRTGWDDKKMGGKKMDNPRGCCLRTPHGHLFHFSVTLFFCRFLSTDLAWSGATSNWEQASFSRFGATEFSV
jgi:hypothetical protein